MMNAPKKPAADTGASKNPYKAHLRPTLQGKLDPTDLAPKRSSL